MGHFFGFLYLLRSVDTLCWDIAEVNKDERSIGKHLHMGWGGSENYYCIWLKTINVDTICIQTGI